MKKTSNLYVGSMGSGKSIAACIDLNEDIQNGYAAIVFDTFKGATDYKTHCSSNHTLIIDNMQEEDFLNRVASWIEDNSGEEKTFGKLNRLLDDKPVPTIIVIENFHSIKNKEKVSKLIVEGKYSNCFFKLVTQRCTQSDLQGLDLRAVVPHVFRVSKIESMLLLGSSAASDIRVDQKGLCYIDSDKIQKQYDYNKTVMNSPPLLRESKDIINRLRKF